MGYRPRRRKSSTVRESRLSYGTPGNGEWFQAHVVRELKALRSDLQGFQSHVVRELNELHSETRAIRREQDTINRRLLLLIASVSDGVAKLNRRMDRQDEFNRQILGRFDRQDAFNRQILGRFDRQDRINRLILKEFRRLRRHR